MVKRDSIYLIAGPHSFWFDDATTITNETHTFANEVVTQTLEDGSQLTDHIIILQDELECQIFVSNSVWQESQDVYQFLKSLRNERLLSTVYTNHEIYDNMAIESVSAPHEAPNVNTLTFTVKFKRIDWSNNVGNLYPREYFQTPLFPASQSFSIRPNGNAYLNQTKGRISIGIRQAKNGFFPNVDNIEMSAVSKNDYGQVVPLDNNIYPASSSLRDIMVKISERNDFTEDEIESFFAGEIDDITTEGATGIINYSSKNEELSLGTIFDVLFENMRFVPGLDSTPLTFNISVLGQSIQFNLYYNNLLKIWKGGIKDAIGKSIVENLTFLAGNNSINALQLKYHKLDENEQVVEEDLVLAGLYVTEPRGDRKQYFELEDADKNVILFEKGPENSQYAFCEDGEDLTYSSICYFVNSDASKVYEDYINGESLQEDNSLEELGDYIIS